MATLDETLKNQFLQQKEIDDEFCNELYKYAMDAIQSTKVVQDIKTSLKKQFDKYFDQSKKLFYRINQISIFNNTKLDIQKELASVSNEEFFFINIPLNYCERKANNLAELCKKIVFASKLNEEQLNIFKFKLLVFFSTINIDVNLEKEDLNQFDDCFSSQFNISNHQIFSSPAD